MAWISCGSEGDVLMTKIAASLATLKVQAGVAKFIGTSSHSVFMQR
jgi:hypothetical protein